MLEVVSDWLQEAALPWGGSPSQRPFWDRIVAWQPSAGQTWVGPSLVVAAYSLLLPCYTVAADPLVASVVAASSYTAETSGHSLRHTVADLPLEDFAVGLPVHAVVASEHTDASAQGRDYPL
eukprot:Blabericola_migrator_1__10601@NODE_602_length_7399_cov_42_568740_g145_i4_p7_GENE_NODE_602_length_7399_cov_42_568740_g145_i4NODE_602_length_7399_cov_42_568740_g145_i4_p7_ORF_typecomplete_len122_score18_50EutA/PF06277_11/0_24_NODE_602_length_7399_cov_42_568740_g145_i425182883